MDVIDHNLSIIQLYKCVSDDYEQLIVKQTLIRKIVKNLAKGVEIAKRTASSRDRNRDLRMSCNSCNPTLYH
jgi:hypothetical protein